MLSRLILCSLLAALASACATAPAKRVVPLASERSAGTKVPYAGSELTVQKLGARWRVAVRPAAGGGRTGTGRLVADSGQRRVGPGFSDLTAPRGISRKVPFSLYTSSMTARPGGP